MAMRIGRAVVAWGTLGGLALACIGGCAHRHVDPYEAAGVNRPSYEEAKANAQNETWKVSDLQWHDSGGGGYWTFSFSPQSPNNPDFESQAGQVSSADFVAIAPTYTERSPAATRSNVIIVRRGSIMQSEPFVEFGERGQYKHTHDAPPGDAPASQPQQPALNTQKVPVSPA